MKVTLVRTAQMLFLAAFFMLLTVGCGDQNSPTSPALVAEHATTPDSTSSTTLNAVGSNATTQAVTLPGFLTLPKPSLTNWPAAAAPGATVTLRGNNFYPKGAFVRPSVRFGSWSQTATVIDNSTITVKVPPGTGTVAMHVSAAGGQTPSVTFRYQTPGLSGLSPSSGPPSQTVTLNGAGFGTRTVGSSFVMFGSSSATVLEWTDTRIVVRAPDDFGTGNNQMIFTSSAGCLASMTPAKWLAKVIQMPSCLGLLNSLYTKYQLTVGSSTLQKAVPVLVRTSAGTSSTRTFLYSVTIVKG